MEDRFLNFIEHEQLFKPDNKLLLAISGGVDSVVLAHLLKQCGFVFAMAHCNFNLRGDDSVGDENFVRELAKTMDVKMFTVIFDTKKHAKENKISTQMAARDLRYTWFDQLIADEGFTHLLTGHHINDSMETVLFNLAKGTGLAGLRGILPKKEKRVRPLLFAGKNEILQYAKENKLEWRKDVSNDSDDYKRNYIRHNIVPLLRELNPSLESTFFRTSERLRDTESFVLSKVDNYKQFLVTKGDDLYIDMKPDMPLVILGELLNPYGFSYSQIKKIKTSINNGAVGKVFNSKTHVLNVDRDSLVVSKAGDDNIDVKIDASETRVTFNTRKLTIEEAQGSCIVKDKSVGCLDYSKLKFPLNLRVWKKGDAFYPLGMRGKKKLSDFMIDEKIPLNLKSRVCVLTSANDIVWVVGHRVDDRYKVTNTTKKTYKVAVASND